MGRYIDADKLWDNRPQIPKGYNEKSVQGFERCLRIFSEQIRKQIDNPSDDVVKVVRCKDCYYSEKMPSVLGECLYCNYWDGNVDDDSYCSKGERKKKQ